MLKLSLFRPEALARDMMEGGRDLGGEATTFPRKLHESVRYSVCVCVCVCVCVWNCVSLMVSQYHAEGSPAHPVQF